MHKIVVEFRTYRIETLYEEKQVLEQVLTYGYDEKAHMIILLKKPMKKKSIRYVSLVSLEEDESKVLYHSKVENEELIGRLKSELYMFVQGHIYYNDDVIKIRYDLLQ